METRKATSLRCLIFILYGFLGVVGGVVLAVSLRILFDVVYSNLLIHGSGNYFAAHTMTAFGAFLMFVSFVGCLSVMKRKICLLCLCVVSLCLLVAIEITSGVIAYLKLPEFHEKVHLGIFWAVQRHYGNDISNTSAIDLIQQSWECCGLNSFASWSNSLYSKRHIPRGTWPTNTFIVPKSCCIEQHSDSCEIMHLNGIRNIDVPVAHVLHLEGCGPKVLSMIDYYVGLLFGFGVVVILLKVTTGILCTVLFYDSIKTGNFIRFKAITTPESATLLLSQPSGSTKQQSPSSAPSYAASRTSLLLAEMPITSLV